MVGEGLDDRPGPQIGTTNSKDQENVKGLPDAGGPFQDGLHQGRIHGLRQVYPTGELCTRTGFLIQGLPGQGKPGQHELPLLRLDKIIGHMIIELQHGTTPLVWLKAA